MHQPCRSCMAPLISSGVTARTPLVRKMSVPRSRRSLAIQLFSFSWSHSPAHSIPTWQMGISHMRLWIMNYFAKLHLTHCMNPRPIINPLLRFYIRLPIPTSLLDKPETKGRTNGLIVLMILITPQELGITLQDSIQGETFDASTVGQAWEVATWIFYLSIVFSASKWQTFFF